MDKQTNYNEFESVYKMSSSDALNELRTYINNPDFSPELEDLLFAETDNLIKKFYGKVRSADLNGYTTNKVYKFSNENLYKLMNKLNRQFKKVLTVGSSGDQAIAAIANGAEEVVIADLNMYTKMFTELKIAAIKNLNHAEFKSYFEFDFKNVWSG